MAKVSKKSEKITAFGGIFFVLDKFDRILSSVIDSHLGLRSKLIGYQYSEIIRAVFSVFCCGCDCMEDLNLYLKDVLTERPNTRVPSADTVLRGTLAVGTDIRIQECLVHGISIPLVITSRTHVATRPSTSFIIVVVHPWFWNIGIFMPCIAGSSYFALDVFFCQMPCHPVWLLGLCIV